MTTGYVVSGVGDLDALFAARVSAPAANVGFLSNGGVDLSQRFEPIGATTPRANTGFISGSTDLALIFKDFAAAANTVNVGNKTTRSFTSGSTATAQYRLVNSGDIQTTEGTNSLVDIGDWINPKSNFGLYSARMTLVSGGPLSSGTMGSWVNLASTQTWTLASPGISGVLTAVATLELRTDADGIVRDTATITFECERAT